jgi:DNA-binding beta-propeller fold protein YncE
MRTAYLTMVLWLAALTSPAQPARFVNFETAPVHPVALSPDGNTLAVCNLPDNRVELFDVSSGLPRPMGDVPVGIDPTSVRWHSTNELWVVNYISSSINVIDVRRRLIVATIQTKAGPADFVFAGTPVRAYVSCAREDVVQVFESGSRSLITNIAIKGDRPKAMDVSPDGSRVYVAIFESGNASTILAPRLTPLDTAPPPSVVADPEGPHHGQDPPPNRGSSFSPPISSYLDSNTYPRGSLIVKKNAAGRWMDDNQGDWTDFVSGAKAARSGRIPGWDMPDRDVAIIDTATSAVTYATGLMNLCMAIGINPKTGEIAVVGTDGKNEVRFEPVLRGVFLRVNLALIDPVTLSKSIRDLNPHLDYSVASVPAATRGSSIGDPRGIVWNAAGTRGYITGMGSHNLVVVDAAGQRVSETIDLDEGPTGLALDENRGRLYVLNRFSATVSAVDLASLTVLTNVPFFDPTPDFIKVGRRHFYDTRRNSGLGHVACASCHPEARFDRLAWDLGIPNGEMFNSSAIPITNYFHPMKGPMVTRTLQDPIARDTGLSLLHWRGDRDGVLDFHVTFTDLQAADRAPTVNEMKELERFLSSVMFPPNRFRTSNNKLPEDLPLPGHFGPFGKLGAGLVADGHPAGQPLPNGNARRGFQLFQLQPDLNTESLRNIACAACHDCQSGRGIERPRISTPRSDGLFFTGAPLRGLDEKIGFDTQSAESRAGFGFFHDGRADTLSRFLVDGFAFTNNQDIADVVAFLLSFSGGEDFSCGGDSSHHTPDLPASVGHQVTLTAPVFSESLSNLFASAERGEYADDIIARGVKDGINRSWASSGSLSDRNGERGYLDDLIALASPDTPLTFTMVPYGTGRRLAIDRDDDGMFDRTELELGSDPLDIRSPSNLPPPEDSDLSGTILLFAVPGQSLNAWIDFGGRWRSGMFGPLHPNNILLFELADPQEAPPGASIPDGKRFVWSVPPTQGAQCWEIRLRVADNARPAPSEAARLRVCVLDLGPFTIRLNSPSFFRSPPNANDVGLFWERRLDVERYEIFTSDSPTGPWKFTGVVHGDAWYDRSPALGRPSRLYRVMAAP